jgi:hypothetical protein
VRKSLREEGAGFATFAVEELGEEEDLEAAARLGLGVRRGSSRHTVVASSRRRMWGLRRSWVWRVPFARGLLASNQGREMVEEFMGFFVMGTVRVMGCDLPATYGKTRKGISITEGLMVPFPGRWVPRIRL